MKIKKELLVNGIPVDSIDITIKYEDNVTALETLSDKELIDSIISALEMDGKPRLGNILTMSLQFRESKSEA